MRWREKQCSWHLTWVMKRRRRKNCTSMARSDDVMRMRWRKRMLACMKWWWALFEHCDKVRVVIVYTLSLHAYDLSLALHLLLVVVRRRVGAEAREETKEENAMRDSFVPQRAHLCGGKWSLAEVRKICTPPLPFAPIEPWHKESVKSMSLEQTLPHLYTICPAPTPPIYLFV